MTFLSVKELLPGDIIVFELDSYRYAWEARSPKPPLRKIVCATVLNVEPMNHINMIYDDLKDNFRKETRNLGVFIFTVEYGSTQENALTSNLQNKYRVLNR